MNAKKGVHLLLILAIHRSRKNTILVPVANQVDTVNDYTVHAYALNV